MSTKLNFTNRVDLEPDCVKTKISPSSSVPNSYEISVMGDLSAANIVGDFTIVLTHKALGETIRYEVKNHSDLNFSIPNQPLNMRNPLDVLTQLEIVQLDQNGIPVIKVSVKNVIPELPGNQSARKSALKTKRDPDLNVPWRLYFTEGYPILHISDKHGLYDQLALTPYFDPLILPEVVKQIFNWLIFDPNMKDNTHVDAWKSIFEQLGCDRAFFDSLPSPNEEDGFMEDLTPAIRSEIEMKSFEVSDRFAMDLELLDRLSSNEIGDE
jgi:hypothetical protein